MRVVAPDPHRIAVLPFRVTTADSLLGEGLAELVATEFTGESSPRAVNMGTVLRAWRIAGGGLRSPLAQDRAIRLARDMGAGFYVEGSVVGLGSRLTINASVVSVPGGEARRAAPVAGPADSLDVLVSRLTSTLLASAGAERAAGRARLTDSPAAMRHYLEGLAQWRAGLIQPAAVSFERALAQDSGFARAAFMRWVVGGWTVAGAGTWGPATWRLRERLSSADRLLLIGQFGADYPRVRPLAQRLADRQQAADQLPESAEAHYFLGDYLYHYASAIGVSDAFARARESFERSVALDSQATVLEHLMEIALQTGDTALALRAFAGYERVAGPAWDWGMAIGALRGDQAMVSAQRRRAGPIGERIPVAFMLPDAAVPADVSDEILELADRYVSFERQFVPIARFTLAIIRGRPAAAVRAAAMLSRSAFLPADDAVAMAALFADGDSIAGAAALERLRALSTSDTTFAATQAACLVAFHDLRGRRAATWNEALTQRGDRRCGLILEAVRAVQERHPDARERLQTADSVSRFSVVIGQSGYDRLALALAWEAFGDIPKALSAVRVRPYGAGLVVVEATRCRTEGRLAALAGDTAGAIAAYQRYLRLRRDPEPVLVPLRDSVRAELARLERR